MSASSGAIRIWSDSTHTIDTEAKAGAKGGAAVTAASAISWSENPVVARLGSGKDTGYSDAGARGDVEIKAQNTETVTTTATGSTNAIDLAIGAAVAIALVDASSEAVVEDDVSGIEVEDDAGSISITANERLSVQTTAAAGQKGEKEKTSLRQRTVWTRR